MPWSEGYLAGSRRRGVPQAAWRPRAPTMRAPTTSTRSQRRRWSSCASATARERWGSSRPTGGIPLLLPGGGGAGDARVAGGAGSTGGGERPAVPALPDGGSHRPLQPQVPPLLPGGCRQRRSGLGEACGGSGGVRRDGGPALDGHGRGAVALPALRRAQPDAGRPPLSPRAHHQRDVDGDGRLRGPQLRRDPVHPGRAYGRARFPARPRQLRAHHPGTGGRRWTPGWTSRWPR